MEELDADGRFLFLSEGGSESAASKLAVAGISYVRRKLESRAENWLRICELIDDGGISAVLAKFTTRTMRLMVDESREGAAEGLLRRIGELPNIVFVH